MVLSGTEQQEPRIPNSDIFGIPVQPEYLQDPFDEMGKRPCGISHELTPEERAEIAFLLGTEEQSPLEPPITSIG